MSPRSRQNLYDSYSEALLNSSSLRENFEEKNTENIYDYNQTNLRNIDTGETSQDITSLTIFLGEVQEVGEVDEIGVVGEKSEVRK